MAYIEIDSRGCGVGKTRNTIIPRIRRNIWNGIRTLVIVPSKNLQKEYARYFDTDDITVINSDSGRIYEQYQTADTPVVCLTHEGFIRTPHVLFEKQGWDLIVDEAFTPFTSETFNNYNNREQAVVNFADICSWRYPNLVPTEKPTVKPQPFFELEFAETGVSTVNSQLFQKLTNPNVKIWATWETGNNLMQGISETTTLQIEINTDTLMGWDSVWIAAAVFEKTFMAYWLESNSIEYDIVYEFLPHSAPVVWHIPQEEFSWSKSYKQRHPETEKTFTDYVNKNRTGRPIYNSNNDSTCVFPWAKRITHNAHGVNEFSDKTDYVFLSAIKPHPLFNNFIKQKLDLTDNQFEFAFTGYMAYQLLMRTALRDLNNTTPVNSFFLDTAQALSIMDLFDPNSYQVKFIEEIQGNKPKPLTLAERQKRWRKKQKENKTDS